MLETNVVVPLAAVPNVAHELGLDERALGCIRVEREEGDVEIEIHRLLMHVCVSPVRRRRRQQVHGSSRAAAATKGQRRRAAQWCKCCCSLSWSVGLSTLMRKRKWRRRPIAVLNGLRPGMP